MSGLTYMNGPLCPGIGCVVVCGFGLWSCGSVEKVGDAGGVVLIFLAGSGCGCRVSGVGFSGVLQVWWDFLQFQVVSVKSCPVDQVGAG